MGELKAAYPHRIPLRPDPAAVVHGAGQAGTDRLLCNVRHRRYGIRTTGGCLSGIRQPDYSRIGKPLLCIASPVEDRLRHRRIGLCPGAELLIDIRSALGCGGGMGLSLVRHCVRFARQKVRLGAIENGRCLLKRLSGKIRFCAPILLTASGVLHGCVSQGSLMGDDQLIIKKIVSDQARIAAVYARNTGVGVNIVGQVKFQNEMMGNPPGFIVVTIINPAGEVLYKACSHYYRSGTPVKPSDIFNFSLTIPLSPPKESIAQLTDEEPS